MYTHIRTYCETVIGYIIVKKRRRGVAVKELARINGKTSRLRTIWVFFLLVHWIYTLDRDKEIKKENNNKNKIRKIMNVRDTRTGAFVRHKKRLLLIASENDVFRFISKRPMSCPVVITRRVSKRLHAPISSTTSTFYTHLYTFIGQGQHKCCYTKKNNFEYDSVR